ncbi:hypothetical protein H2200_002842 [Cladophialophora chaetospira]|uniref:Uncharacterized protein n=1 Tax=Cladophialophora chaetospira TaxID=386627 RepID=A0AA38XGY0_9EURO|nr:hypothetical protein H2200_002842 [Cladophialophora chaetospira]
MKKGRVKKPKKRRANSQRQEHNNVEHQSNVAHPRHSRPFVSKRIRDTIPDVENVEVENRPFVDSQRTETQLQDTEVKTFMCDGGSLAIWIAQAEDVTDFCDGVNLESFEVRERAKDDSNKIVAWLDERNIQGETRTRAKPLTAYGLYLELTKPTKDRGGFELSFHLAYFVWRTSETERNDHRRFPDGRPLRQSRDISFVRRNKKANAEFLYEGQVSCVIAGHDDSRWVAYCFSDTYFDLGADTAGEDILEEEEEVEHGDVDFHTDPLVGDADANRPESNPWIYFLKVFDARLAKTRGEWQLTARNMKKILRDYDWARCVSESTMRKNDTEAMENYQVLRQSSNYVTRVMDLATQLSESLYENVDAVEKLLTEDVPRLDVFSSLPQCHPLLDSIKMELRELQRLKNALDQVKKRWVELARMLELDLQNESTKVGYDNRGLSLVMMLYVSPIAMSASVFSMNSEVIAFLSPGPKSFLGLLLVFVGIALIHSLVTWPPKRVLTLARNIRPELQVGALRLNALKRRHTIMPDEEHGEGTVTDNSVVSPFVHHRLGCLVAKFKRYLSASKERS